MERGGGRRRGGVAVEGTAYEADASAWALEQADHLRAGRWSRLDVVHLADEIEALARSERRALTSALQVILLHLLKWDHQRVVGTRSWVDSIRTQRLAIAEDLEDNPSLVRNSTKSSPAPIAGPASRRPSETGLDDNAFPAECPYTFDDVMTRPVPWPAPGRGGLIIASDLSPGHGARLTVDLAALVANWRALAARAPQAECGAVVKADAYGCGLSAVAPALARAGCRTVFVAHLSEGIAARKLLPEAAIYVLNGLPPGAGAAFAGHALRPVLGDREELAEWAAVSDGRLPAALHVDTGMNRLGLSVAQALELAGDPVIGQAGIDLVMSHLVSAECPPTRSTPGRPPTSLVFARHSRARAPRSPTRRAPGSRAIRAHDLLRRAMPCSAAIRSRAVRTRCGPWCGWRRRSSRSAMSRPARPAATMPAGPPRPAPPRHPLPRLRRRRLSPRGERRGRALVGGVPCPILGLISMDLIILDVTDAPAARRGGTATLIGDRLDIDTVGQAAGTIGYEILTGLGSRYVRNYVE